MSMRQGCWDNMQFATEVRRERCQKVRTGPTHTAGLDSDALGGGVKAVKLIGNNIRIPWEDIAPTCNSL